MNNVFTAKLLQNLQAKKKGNKGFTLIELLVVVIIIGVLAAVALPNLLSQVGKARETEAKNAMGTINRTQQSYHFEKQIFTPALTNANLAANNVLGVIIASKYFDISTGTGTAAGTNAAAGPLTGDTTLGAKDGVRNYSAGIGFNSATSAYASVLCQNDTVGVAAQTVTIATAPACPANTIDLK
jgi:type IV pilus assembly protein PilA